MFFLAFLQNKYPNFCFSQFPIHFQIVCYVNLYDLVSSVRCSVTALISINLHTSYKTVTGNATPANRINHFNSRTCCHTVLCKSNANDNRWISRVVLTISRWFISDKSHRLANAKMINQRDIGTIFVISRRDIGLGRICCNDISQSETIYHHDISLQRSSL